MGKKDKYKKSFKKIYIIVKEILEFIGLMVTILFPIYEILKD